MQHTISYKTHSHRFCFTTRHQDTLKMHLLRLLLVALAGLVGPARPDCHVEGFCRGQSLALHLATPHEEACRVYCKQTPDCQHYSYDSDGVCNLLETCEERLPCGEDAEDCYSGGVDCETCGFDGGCQGGNVLGRRNVPYESRCLVFCQETHNCSWYSFERRKQDEGSCTLFDSCPKVSVTKPTNSTLSVTSGDPTCPVFSCFEDGQCHGRYLGHRPARSKEECLTECLTDARCTWFTFYAEDRLCALYETCESLDDDCNACVSGQAECAGAN